MHHRKKNSEVEVEEVVVKHNMRGEKKATDKKGDGCKPTKATGSKDLDDDEGNICKKKPNSRSSSRIAKDKNGKTKKAVTMTKKTGGDNTKKVSQSKRMIVTVLMKMPRMTIW